MINGKIVVFNGRVYSNYTITTDGRIFNTKTGRELKHTIIGTRHEAGVSLYINGTQINVKVALLVLETYKGRPTQLTNKHSGLSWSVNHIDGDWTNNNLSNLEWQTVSDNLRLYWADVKAGRKTR